MFSLLSTLGLPTPLVAFAFWIVSVLTAVYVFRLYTRPDVWADEVRLLDAMSEVDDCVVRTESDGVNGSYRLSRVSFLAAMAFKEKYGELKYTTANRLVAGEFVRDWLREKYPDMRNVDRVRHATLAIEWCLVPLSSAVVAADMAGAAAILQRRAAVQPAR